MTIEEKVRNVLEHLDVADPKVEIKSMGGYRIVAGVVSESFENMDEGERQELVWGALLDNLEDRESRLVEFVFTDSPSEREAEAHAESQP